MLCSGVMRFALAFALLTVGCARPLAESERVAAVDPAVVAPRPIGFESLDRALAEVDARRDEKPEPQAVAPASLSASEARPSALAERASEPAAKPRNQAFEVESPSGKVVIVERSGPKLSRWEAERLAARCERRQTRWAREHCLAGR